MEHRLFRRSPLLALALVAGLPLAAIAIPPALAGHDDTDQDRARAALQEGRILPLAEILLRIAVDYPGRVIEVDYEEEDGHGEYEIEILQSDGRLLELEVDAATARILDRDYEEED